MNASEAAVNTSEPRGFNGSERCPRDARVAQLVFPAAYTALFLAGLLLNGLALWVFLHIPSSSTFIVYLKNTLVADLLMALTLPFKILSDARLGPWQLRAFVCRFSAIVFYEAMYAAIILLGLIAFDRCLKILRPFGKFSVQRPAFARAVSALAWAFLFALSLPNMVLTDREATPASVRKCAALKGPRGLAWHQLVNDVSQAIFWTVLALMLLFYAVIAWKVYASHRRAQGRDSRGQKKVEGKVFVVVAVFFVCFAPFHFARVPYTRSQTRGGGADCRLQDRLYLAKESTLFLAATNICMDPLIYIFLCRKFRDRLPCWKRRRGNAAPGPENQSSQTDNMTLS